MNRDDFRDSFRFSWPRVRPFDFLAALEYVAAAPIVYLAEVYLLMGPLGLEVSRLGAMWGVIAAVFVIHDSRAATMKQTVLRVVGTVFGVLVMLAYLTVFPFHVIGLAVCLGVGALLCRALGRGDLVIVTLITITVIMIDAGNPAYQQAPLLNPVLRFGDTLIGGACGTLVVYVSSLLYRSRAPNDAGP